MAMLTKSKYLLGLQCPKLLWMEINKQTPEPDESAKHKFEVGNIVGELAKKVFPDGIDIPTEDFKANLNKTQENRFFLIC